VIGACERLVLLQRTTAPDLTPEALATDLLDFFWLGFQRLFQGERWTPPPGLAAALKDVHPGSVDPAG
jgi:hypothetical protein